MRNRCSYSTNCRRVCAENAWLRPSWRRERNSNRTLSWAPHKSRSAGRGTRIETSLHHAEIAGSGLPSPIMATLGGPAPLRAPLAVYPALVGLWITLGQDRNRRAFRTHRWQPTRRPNQTAAAGCHSACNIGSDSLLMQFERCLAL